jgi:hypothetical protein
MQAAGHAGLPARRGAVAGFCRLLICGLLILILAEPRAVRTSDVVSVVYNVDVSDSVNEARNQALEMVAGTAAESRQQIRPDWSYSAVRQQSSIRRVKLFRSKNISIHASARMPLISSSRWL